MRLSAVLLASSILIGASAVVAQGDYEHEMMVMHDKMMSGMAMPSTGDPDKDFAMMMISHHQGAIDMAKLELEYGKDAEMRALAEAIIEAQEKEIEQLRAWLAGVN